jgi:hypothetical protein
MRIVPPVVEQYVRRVDPRYRTWVGISWALLAAWAVIKVFLLLFAPLMFPGYYWSPVSLIFYLVMWVAIGIVAMIGAVAFLTAGRDG